MPQGLQVRHQNTLSKSIQVVPATCPSCGSGAQPLSWLK